MVWSAVGGSVGATSWMKLCREPPGANSITIYTSSGVWKAWDSGDEDEGQGEGEGEGEGEGKAGV